MGSPVTYAEQELRVHDVWVQAAAWRDELSEQLHEEAQMQNLIAAIKDERAVAEFDLLADMSTDLSATARKAEQTRLARESSSMRELDRRLSAAQAEHRRVVARVRATEFRLKANIARMNELGGLLMFYAARSPARH